MNNLKPIQVIAVPAFHDNYLWLFHRDDGQQEDSQAWVVDPGDAQVILEALKQRELNLAGILITHHHADHTGGIDDLLKNFPNIPVYGPGGGSVPQVTHPLKDGDAIKLAEAMEFRILSVPGHTLDHIAYFRAAQNAEAPILFCGDTLFAGGCGRLFEGTPAQMYQSLSKLSELPEATKVYCAHEYTLANLAFAVAVEPDNDTLIKRIASAKQTRAQLLPTVPTTIGLELATNPFMRSHVDSIMHAAEQHSGKTVTEPSQVLAAIRSWKDNF